MCASAREDLLVLYSACVQVQEKIWQRNILACDLCKCKRRSASIATRMCASAGEDLLAQDPSMCPQVTDKICWCNIPHVCKCRRRSATVTSCMCASAEEDVLYRNILHVCERRGRSASVTSFMCCVQVKEKMCDSTREKHQDRRHGCMIVAIFCYHVGIDTCGLAAQRVVTAA